MVKIKNTQFCVKNLKMKRKKRTNFFDLPERGFEPQIFSNFDEIKSKQASKRDRNVSKNCHFSDPTHPSFLVT